MPTTDNLADLIEVTLDDLGKPGFTEIASALQDYVAMTRLIRRERVQFESGTGVEKRIMLDHSGAAKNVLPYEQDSYNVADVMGNFRVPWRHTNTNWGVERTEIAMNRDPARIVELIKVRRADAMISLAERMETDFWSKPADSSDETTPFGVLYWIVSNATTGFNGGNPAGFSGGAGGLSSTTYPRWANYTAQYTNMTKDDGVTAMRDIYRKIQFKSPTDHPNHRKGPDKYEIFTNDTGIAAVETVGEQQNENLGRDIARMDDRIVFRGRPVHWVPQLDGNADVTDPFIFINWAVLNPVFLRGEFLHEETHRAPNQHKVTVTDTDLTWNVCAVNRRRLGILTK